MNIDILGTLSRFLHISCIALLIGGMFYAWGSSKKGLLKGRIVDGFQPGVLVLVGVILLTGLYNLMLKMGAGVPKMYHMVFGIKFLLFLHIAAVSLLLGKQGTSEEKANRLVAGVAISGLAVFFLSAILRALSTAQ